MVMEDLRESKGNVVAEAAQIQCCRLQSWRKPRNKACMWPLEARKTRRPPPGPAERSTQCVSDFAALMSNFVVKATKTVVICYSSNLKLIQMPSKLQEKMILTHYLNSDTLLVKYECKPIFRQIRSQKI